LSPLAGANARLAMAAQRFSGGAGGRSKTCKQEVDCSKDRIVLILQRRHCTAQFAARYGSDRLNNQDMPLPVDFKDWVQA